MGGVQFAFFSDPDGNRWVIQGATPPDIKDAHLTLRLRTAFPVCSRARSALGAVFSCLAAG